MDSRRIRVSQKRQITIPLKYYELLNISDQVECFMHNGEIVLRPIQENDDELSELILEGLITQGFSGDKLLVEFKKVREKVRPAVKKMIEEAKHVDSGSKGYRDEMDEVFGDIED